MSAPSGLHKQQISEFVRESDRLSGIQAAPGDEVIERHKTIAAILLAEPHRFVSIEIINGALTGRTHGWFRTGTEGSLVGAIPPASEVPQLVGDMNASISKTLQGFTRRTNSFEDRERFAWRMHDYLFCLHAFKEGNERTARLLMNHIRVLLGLEVFVIPYGDAKYFEKLKKYRTEKFLRERLM